jgi:hypothetical protein
MEASIVEISSKGIVMAMAYGQILLRVVKTIRATICWIKSMDTVFMIGQTAIYTKEYSLKTKDVEKGSCFTIVNWSMKAFGSMGRDVMSRNFSPHKMV